MEIGIAEIAAGVCAGNMLTAACLWGLREANKHEEGKNVPPWALFAIAGTGGFIALTVFAST